MMQMQVIFSVTVRRARLAFPPAPPHPAFVARASACMDADPRARPSFAEVLERLDGVEGGREGEREW